MEYLQQAVDIFFNLDTHLNAWAGVLGPWLYLVLFLIIFCETGLVVTPFLPGDSLLFAVGALASVDDSPLHLPWLCLVLFAAAVAGDAVNYAIGSRLGPRVFRWEDSRFFNKKHLLRTHRFYEKYGGKTIVLARFIPIVRTFAPFVAGIGSMTYSRFALFNVSGGAFWILSFVLGGYFFGNLPFVKEHFHFVVVAIILLSIMPPIVEYVRMRREAGAAAAEKGVG
jgi:membrane-associated protein